MRCSRAGVSSLLHSGGFGHQRSGKTTGVGVETLDWDRRARVTPVEQRTIFAPVGGYRIVRSRHVPGSMAWS